MDIGDLYRRTGPMPRERPFLPKNQQWILLVGTAAANQHATILLLIANLVRQLVEYRMITGLGRTNSCVPRAALARWTKPVIVYRTVGKYVESAAA